MAAHARIALFAVAVLPLFAQVAADPNAALHAQRAKEAEKNNDFATAVREYKFLTGLYPHSAELRSNLGVALYFDRDLPRALLALKQAIALNSALLAPHLFSGLALYRLSDPDAAVSELSIAAKINPADVLAHIWLGYAFLAQGSDQKALAELQAASILDPRNIDIWYELGQTYLQIGKDATRRLLELNPDGSRVWQLAGEQARMQGDRKKALEDFRNALERRPDSPELQIVVTELGGSPTVVPRPESADPQQDTLLNQAHDAEQKAQKAFERLAQIAPDSYRAHEIMGDSLTVQQQFNLANQEYRAALNLNPDLTGVHQAIGANLLRTGKAAEALQEFQAELAIQPRSASVRTYAGEALLLLGRDEEAEKMLSSAMALDRPPIELYRLFGKLEMHRKNYSAAIRALSRYVSIRKDDATAYYLLSRAYDGIGNSEQGKRARTLFEKTSRDARVRDRARTELESFNRPGLLADVTIESTDLNTNDH